MKLAIQGIGAVTPMDDSQDCPYDGSPDIFFREFGHEPVQWEKESSRLHKVKETSDVVNFVPPKKLRRIDRFSRLGLLAAGRAIEDTAPDIYSKENLGVIVATGFGALETTFCFLDSYINKGDGLASPTHFSNSVHNAVSAHISICYGLQGPNMTVSQ
ncbi:MAG: beta-ketoacyl synthase chain length factor, partial [Desulfamplus sp.]|nr:beta-ketoacyl synthase chain length factor [Desulfamplus sp.]